MNHLRQAWANRIHGYSGPVGGISLKDLWDGMQAFMSIAVETVLQPGFGEPTSLAKEKVPFGTNFKQFMADLERKAQARHREIDDLIERWQPIRYVLIAHGRNQNYLLGEKTRLGASDWDIPRQGVGKQGSHSRAEPYPTFLRTLHYDYERLPRLWAEEIADVPYDDSQFDLIEGKPHVIIYRGIGLAPGVDPASASHPETGGTGYSWSISEQTAEVIAERGGAGFSGNNAPRDSYGISVRQEQRGALKVPTVLRAEVVLTGEAAKPYRPWNWSYRSELEVDVPAGTPILVTGWKQAKAVPLSQKLYDRAHDPDVDPYGPEGVYYVRYEWGRWHTGRWERKAMQTEAGPASGVIPDRVKYRGPVNPRQPRGVVLDPMAKRDLQGLYPDERNKVQDVLDQMERGRAPLEPKQRDELRGTFCVRVDADCRLCVYPHIDGTWHVFYIGHHDYDEAERRMSAPKAAGG